MNYSRTALPGCWTGRHVLTRYGEAGLGFAEQPLAFEASSTFSCSFDILQLVWAGVEDLGVTFQASPISVRPLIGFSIWNKKINTDWERRFNRVLRTFSFKGGSLAFSTVHSFDTIRKGYSSFPDYLKTLRARSVNTPVLNCKQRLNMP